MSDQSVESAVVVDEMCGRYRLQRRLATGGMGQVFLATLAGAGGFEKRVAVKRLLPHLAEEERFVAMFLDEARIAARLSHPNICSVYEVGEGGGSYYIAMEYLEGLTCSQLIRRCGGALEPGLAVGILQQAAEGLHSAHELRDNEGHSLGVIHRDVTPSNIFVCTSGLAKILDFGVAKARDTLLKTQAGTLKGKFGYMSPEHLKAVELDRRSDVFSLGIVAHELLTGRRLFRRDSMYLTTMAILQEPIPRLDPTVVTMPVVEVVARALARDRDERYNTTLEFAEALAAALPQSWSRGQIRDYLAAIELPESADSVGGSYPSITNTNTGHHIPKPAPARELRAVMLPSAEPVQARRQATLLHQGLFVLFALLALILVTVLAYHAAL